MTFAHGTLAEIRNIAFGTHYRIAGSGRPVLLIHDRGRDLAMWEPLLAPLAAGFRIVRYDLLGHGLSAKPAGELGWRDWEAQLRLLIDYLKIPDAVAAGIGLGAELAQAVTADRAALDRAFSEHVNRFIAEPQVDMIASLYFQASTELALHPPPYLEQAPSPCGSFDRACATPTALP
ncbi:MAG TPA: alpha/beta fold hydrolase [Hypericibacter adhaerens]|uniref:AB hydrolase-1 domain-containing protein n=1 Tax=Hypericibacter adhaerens TaxID=2602016 RepID=A0A5J6MTK0_9PROT|nr:alpha/beta fold hydrolase [Hypericibacter adhaerens]QEX20992.1 hypothetical protein FRZ61_09120 [Hypericibacter adhaerens]HWA45304.1 alpha/beta fold hydrolase [Hypericibacter adhaerens]